MDPFDELQYGTSIAKRTKLPPGLARLRAEASREIEPDDFFLRAAISARGVPPLPTEGSSWPRTALVLEPWQFEEPRVKIVGWWVEPWRPGTEMAFVRSELPERFSGVDLPPWFYHSGVDWAGVVGEQGYVVLTRGAYLDPDDEISTQRVFRVGVPGMLEALEPAEVEALYPALERAVRAGMADMRGTLESLLGMAPGAAPE